MMSIMTQCIVLCTLVFTLLFVSSAPPAPVRRTSLELPDYGEFILRWMPTLCLKSRACRDDVKNITRLMPRGFWPNPTYKGPKYLIPYDKTKMVGIENELRDYMKSATSESDESLWQQEWNDHGAYSGFGQSDYFKLIIDLSKRFRPSLENTIFYKVYGGHTTAPHLRMEFGRAIDIYPKIDCIVLDRRLLFLEIKIRMDYVDGQLVPESLLEGGALGRCHDEMLWIPNGPTVLWQHTNQNLG